MDPEDRHDRESLLPKLDDSPPPASFLPLNQRPYADKFFTFLFLFTILTTYAWGIFAVSRADLYLVSKHRHSHYNPNTKQCEIVGSITGEHASMYPQVRSWLPLVAWAASLPTGFALLWLLRRYTRVLVVVATPLMALLPIGICVAWFTWCYGVSETCATALPVNFQVGYALAMWALGAFSAYRFCQSWSGNAFEAKVQLLTMATDALLQHWWLLVVLPALSLVCMVLVLAPVVNFLEFASHNGSVVPGFDASGSPCCVLRRPEWSSAYYYFAWFTTIWAFLVTIYLQVMVVSGTISQWYFAPTGSSTKGTIWRSLRIAIGPSFGTACNLGTIITTLAISLLGLFKNVVEGVANSGNREGFISVILRAHFQWLFQFPDSSSRFAPYFAIVSGNNFWESTKKATSLLRRNSLSTTGREFAVPTQQVPTAMVFAYSLLQSIAVYWTLEYFLSPEPMMNFLTAVFCFSASITGLLQITTSIACVIDTVYICFAMEKDAGDASKSEICQAFVCIQQTQAVA